MYFHVPTFSEFDVPLVVIFRFIRYGMWGRSRLSDPLKLRESITKSVLHWLHIFQTFLHNHERKLIVTTQTEILLHNPATRSKFN